MELKENGKNRLYLYEETKTTEFVQRILKSICWFGSPNFWFEDLDMSPSVRKIHGYYSKFMPIFTVLFILFQLVAFGTQRDLTPKQHSNMYLMTGAFILFSFYVGSIGYHTDHIRVMMWKMMVQMIVIHNDKEVEEHFIDHTTFYIKLNTVLWIGEILFFGMDCLVRTIMTGDTFVTMLTGWPDTHDRSMIAFIARVIIFIMFVVDMMYFFTTYVLIMPVTIGLSHQYMNLGKYFKSLNAIFKGEGDQHQKEIEYETKLKIGIKCHAEMLWCVSSIQNIFSVLNGGQIFHTTLALFMLMYQYTQMEQTIVMVLSLMFTATSILLSTGCLMWKAGDITFEAAAIPTAIFCSGWQHCTKKASRRVRPLLVISMAVAQIPVELKGLGLVSFSYNSYVTIVKIPYTVFSVLF